MIGLLDPMQIWRHASVLYLLRLFLSMLVPFLYALWLRDWKALKFGGMGLCLGTTFESILLVVGMRTYYLPETWLFPLTLVLMGFEIGGASVIVTSCSFEIVSSRAGKAGKSARLAGWGIVTIIAMFLLPLAFGV